MIAHAKRAMVYVLIIATTFVGSRLLSGRGAEAGAASMPLAETTGPVAASALLPEAADFAAASVPLTGAADPAPLIFEAGGRTCVYIAGQLECFCSCADVRAGCGAALGIGAESQVGTVSLSGTGAEGVTDTETTSTLSRTTSVVLPGSDSDTTDEPDAKPKCNQGVGNGPEGCDPGNSNHNQPSNDEEGGTPGSPGRQGGSKTDGQDGRPAKPDKDD